MNLNLIAPINQLGYGIAGINILKALQKLDVNVSLFPIGQPQVTSEEDAKAVNKGLESARLFYSKAHCIRIWHQHDMAQFVGKGEHIGFPIFELDTFNDLEKHHLSSVDRLFVCSEWAKKIVYNQIEKLEMNEAMGWGDYAVNVIPLGVDMNIFKPTPTNCPTQKTIFFNCGKWEVRKGHDILIEAFKKVAKEYKNVELWMMCSNPFNSPEEDAKWLNLYNHPQVRLIPRGDTQSDVYNIMSRIDCGVFPSRGEGWNLELLEVMAIGKHVIATDYAAHTEFCNQDNCRLIPINGVAPAFDGKWFFGQGNWADINSDTIDKITEQMIDFHLNKSFNYYNSNGVATAEKFSWENTAKEIIKNVL